MLIDIDGITGQRIDPLLDQKLVILHDVGKEPVTPNFAEQNFE